MRFDKTKFGFITDCKTTYWSEDCGKYVQYPYYTCWSNMIQRCYNEKHPSYNAYGGKGVYVSDEFKSLKAFRDFFISNNPDNSLDIDKDTLGKGYYGKDSVVFISHSDNIKESLFRRRDESSLRMRNSVGNKHPRAKSKEHYLTNPTSTSNFKKICKTQGWDFDSFEKIKTNYRAKDRHILYCWKEIEVGD